LTAAAKYDKRPTLNKKSEPDAISQRIPPAAASALEADGEGTLREAAQVAASVHRPGESPSEAEPGRAKQ